MRVLAFSLALCLVHAWVIAEVPPVPTGLVVLGRSVTDSFSADFENTPTFQSLFVSGGWHDFNRTFPQNVVEPVSLPTHSGALAVKFVAVASPAGGAVSKASIMRTGMKLFHGETVDMTVWYFMPGTLDAGGVVLIDVEDSTPIPGSSPGIRLMVSGKCLAVERGKFGESTLRQSDPCTVFPRDTWTQVRWKIGLSRTNGFTKVYQNGALILSKLNVQTLPVDVPGVIEGSINGYNRVEIGLTANNLVGEHVLYADDFSLTSVCCYQ